MDGGASWATVHRVAKSQIRLSNFTLRLSQNPHSNRGFPFTWPWTTGFTSLSLDVLFCKSVHFRASGGFNELVHESASPRAWPIIVVTRSHLARQEDGCPRPPPPPHPLTVTPTSTMGPPHPANPSSSVGIPTSPAQQPLLSQQGPCLRGPAARGLWASGDLAEERWAECRFWSPTAWLCVCILLALWLQAGHLTCLCLNSLIYKTALRMGSPQRIIV